MHSAPSFLLNGILISSAFILAVLMSYLFRFSRTLQVLLAVEIFPENITQEVKNSRPLKCFLIRSVTVMRMPFPCKLLATFAGNFLGNSYECKDVT
jgi:hypothetical protein